MCNYNFELPVDPIPLMALVKQMIEENGGTVTGQDSQRGGLDSHADGPGGWAVPARGQLPPSI